MFTISIIDKSKPITINNHLEGFDTTAVDVEANSYAEALERAVENNYIPCENKTMNHGH